MEKGTIKKWSFVTLIVIFIITAMGVYSARNLKIDYDYEKYFPKEDISLKRYTQFTTDFGEDGNYILVGIKNNNGIFDSSFLSKVVQFGDELKTLDNVETLVSPCHECFFYQSNGLAGIEKKACIGFKDLKSDSLKIYQTKKLIGSLFSPNANAITLYISTPNQLNKEPGEQLVTEINNAVKKWNFDEVHVAGKINTTLHFTKKLGEELVTFFLISLVLVCLFLGFTFKSLWGVLVPLVIVIFAILWTLIIMDLSGKSFDLLMIMLPTIVFVVGMSDLIHFLNRFLDELRQGQNKYAAIKISFKEVGLATFLTSITTAIGFFSLVIVEIEPVKEFGIFSGISVLVAYFLSFLMLPLFLYLLPAPKKLIQTERKKTWETLLSKAFSIIFKRKKTIYITATILTVAGIFAINQLKVNNFLLEDLSEEDPVKKGYRFFEQNFSGVRPFEMELKIGPSSTNIYDFKTAKEIDKIETYLESNYTEKGVGFMISPLDPIRLLYSIKHNNKPRYFRVPEREKTYSNQVKQLKKNSALSSHKFVSSDSSRARVSGKIEDIGSLAIKNENLKFTQFIKDSIDASLITVSLTGTPLLIDKNNENLSKNILLGLILAFLIIGIILGIIFKTWIIVIIALIVNALPLICIGGLMFLFNFDIKISTSLIFTLAFGIAVDDTIHLLSKLKLLLHKGQPLEEALKNSYLSTGKAIIVTSLILCGGFLSLMFSNFMSIQTMGILVSITLFLAVIIDLTLLPLLLTLFKKQLAPNPTIHKTDLH